MVVKFKKKVQLFERTLSTAINCDNPKISSKQLPQLSVSAKRSPADLLWVSCTYAKGSFDKFPQMDPWSAISGGLPVCLFSA